MAQQFKVYVGDLDWGATEDDLRNSFEQYGNILSTFAAKHRDSQKPRGFGFVEFESPEICQQAIDGANESGMEILGRPVRCNMAQPRGAWYTGEEAQEGEYVQPKPRRRQQQQQQEFRVYAGKFADETTEEIIRSTFEPYGNILDLHIVKHWDSGNFRGIAFIEYDTLEAAEAAIDGENGNVELGKDGQRLRVNMAQPRGTKYVDDNYNNQDGFSEPVQQRGGGGGGFGGGGSGFGGGQVEHKVYVGKLSFDATVEDLRYAFQEHGEITDVFIPKDHETKESRGFAFVTFTTLDSANAAIAALNGAEIAGREVECNLAKPKGRGGRGRGQGRRDGGRGEY